MNNETRKAIAAWLGIPEKSLTPEVAQQYELTEDGVILKEEKHG